MFSTTNFKPFSSSLRYLPHFQYEAARLLGWTKQAETYNGRFAMFFLVVGLLTEYWTGVSLPGQIEEMLRVAGVIDMS